MEPTIQPNHLPQCEQTKERILCLAQAIIDETADVVTHREFIPVNHRKCHSLVRSLFGILVPTVGHLEADVVFIIIEIPMAEGVKPMLL